MTDDVEHIALSIAEDVANLRPAALARLRLPDEVKSHPDFYRMMGRHDVPYEKLDPWAAIACSMALLMPRGIGGQGLKLHNPDRHPGDLLCDGGDPNWPHSRSGSPFVSEKLVARTPTLPETERRKWLVDLFWRLGPADVSDEGINVIDIAHLFLTQEAFDETLRRYYRRLMQAQVGVESFD